MEGILTKVKLIILALFFWVSAPAQMFGSLAADDYDAAQFCKSTIANITDPTQRDAVNILVKETKSYGLWTKNKAIYPLVGGTSTAHSYNIINPSLYQLTFVGSPTHDGNGVDWNGSTQYATTGLVPTSVLGANNTHLSVYSRENSTGAYTEIGASGSANTQLVMQMLLLHTNGNMIHDAYYGTGNGRISAANTNSSGFFVSSRITSTDFRGYRNGSQLGTTGANATGIGSPPSIDLYIGATHYVQNDAPGTTVLNFSTRQLAFVSVGTGLTASEVATYYSIVQRYETKLGRQL
jgi:hypothetical protein